MADHRADRFDRADFSARPDMAFSFAQPSWQPSELRPDDQIVSIVETGSPPAAPLTDDARSGFVLRNGDSNRVMLVDTGPAPRIVQGAAVPLVKGSPVALAEGAALPRAADQAERNRRGP